MPGCARTQERGRGGLGSGGRCLAVLRGGRDSRMVALGAQIGMTVALGCRPRRIRRGGGGWDNALRDHQGDGMSGSVRARQLDAWVRSRRPGAQLQ